MQVSSSEGLANHTVPESCVGPREGDGEALTGVRIGATRGLWSQRQRASDADLRGAQRGVCPHGAIGHAQHPSDEDRRGLIAAAMGLSSALVEQVDAVFADMDKPGHPGAALLVIDHDEIVYSKCYGLADLETQRPITARTRGGRVRHPAASLPSAPYYRPRDTPPASPISNGRSPLAEAATVRRGLHGGPLRSKLSVSVLRRSCSAQGTAGRPPGAAAIARGCDRCAGCVPSRRQASGGGNSSYGRLDDLPRLSPEARLKPTPAVTLTDRTIPHLRPEPGKRVIYVDRALKGFGVRVSEHGRMSDVLTYGANRERIKLGDVGIVKLAEAREQARNILAERQLGMRQASGTETYERALATFLEAAKAKNKERTVGGNDIE